MPSSATKLAHAGTTIARQLASSAHVSDGEATWHAEVLVGANGDAPVIEVGDVGPTLYDGTAGIGLSLAACAAIAAPSEAKRFDGTARGACRRALGAVPDLLESDRLGLFDGVTGIALSAVTVGRTLGDPQLVDGGTNAARAARERLHELLAEDGSEIELDLISGLAGTMLGLQSIASTTDDQGAAPMLERAVDRLIAAQVPQTWGAAWPTAPGATPLLGLGHGAAGIALALAEAHEVSNDHRALRARAEALEYERSWYDADDVSWPDLREHVPPAEPSGSMTAWCHGAIGIGLGRLRLLQLAPQPCLVAEISASLQAAREVVIEAGTALRDGRPSDCTFCHGLAGVVELLLLAGKTLGATDHTTAAERVAQLLLEQREAAGAWPCGVPGAGETPGLMTGTAGIALALMRAAGVVETPSPLVPGLPTR